VARTHSADARAVRRGGGENGAVSDPADLGVVEATALLRERRLSPSELVTACLARIRERDGTHSHAGDAGSVNAWVRVYEEDALSAAAHADALLAAGHDDLPPLCGIPVGLKDLYAVAGKPLTGSSLVLAEVPQRDSDVWARLSSAGAILLGHLHTHELAIGGTTDQVGNPWALERSAGGSSGGSAAALAAGLVEAALGSDTGGSIRIPAACCGIVGFKPTYGLVPLEGCFPLAPSLDHGGPMARTVAGCAEMLEALVPGFAPNGLESLEEVDVGIVWTDVVQPLVRARVEEAAARFPRSRGIELPFAEDVRSVFMHEVADTHRELYAEHGDLYSANVAAKLELCLAVTDAEYEAGLRTRERYREIFDEALDGLDLLVAPTLPFVAPLAGLDERNLRGELTRLTWSFNVLGAPALALPCGPAEDGLPASMQLVGRPGDDARVLAAGARLEPLLKR
jgi:aspartyl-tRNA(Asn)/glutamyl-tRNA(Gln) amidotransferase subunit A